MIKGRILYLKEYVINNKKYRLNIFDELDKDSAYLIGYLSGDGNYHKPTIKRKSRLGMTSTDKYLIESIRDKYCPDTTIKYGIPINKSRNIISTKESGVMVFSSKFSGTFRKYGILDLKENRVIQNIPDNLIRYFILGLFDADGHISFGNRTDRDRLYCNIGFTHRSDSFLQMLKLYIETTLDINCGVNKRKDEKCSDLKFSKLESVTLFIEWLYNSGDLPFVYNKEKREKSNKFLNLYLFKN